MNEEPVSWLLGADDVLELPEVLPVEVVPTGCDDIGFAIEDMVASPFSSATRER
jgi:hypothetical protein